MPAEAEGNVTNETRCSISCFEDEGRGHEPTNTSNAPLEIGRQGNSFSRGGGPADTLILAQ